MPTIQGLELTDQASAERRTAYRLTHALLSQGSLELVSELAHSLSKLDDRALRLGLLDALAEIDDQPALNTIWVAWAETRQPDLDAFLEKSGWLATRPEQLRVLSALKTRNLAALAQIGSEGIETLLQACRDPDLGITQTARQTLRSLQDPAAQDELCRWVVEHDHPEARLAALDAGYAPSDLQWRALFFLLTGQWERYEQLDFDASLLGAVYEAGDTDLRTRIAETARQAGWAGFVEAVAGSRTARRLSALSEVEWELVLALLGRSGRWQEAWKLAQAAPAFWSAQLLRCLAEAGWSPQQAEAKNGFENLFQMGAACLKIGRPMEWLAGPALTLTGHTRRITSMVFSPDGGLLASGSADRSLRLWGLPGGELVKNLEGHTGYVLCLAVSPDGSLLASGSADKTVRLWRLPGGQPFKILGGHAGEVLTVSFSPDGKTLAAGDRAGARLWDPAGAKLLRLLPVEGAGITRLVFAGSSKILVGGSEDRTIYFWDVAKGELLRTLMENAVAWALSLDGSCLATQNQSGQVRLWQAPSGELEKTLSGHAAGGLLAFSPDQKWLAGSDPSGVRLWRLPGAVQAFALQPQARPPASLAFNPQGNLLAGGSANHSVQLWRLADGAPLESLSGINKIADQLVFSPDGKFLAAADADTVRLWKLEDLGTLFQTPAALLGNEQVVRAEALLLSSEITEIERQWLEFTLALYRWNRRHDIAIEVASPRISIGEFDIEIEI